MATTHDQRFAEIEANLLDAQRNYPSDLQRAGKTSDADANKAAVQQNYNNAQTTYFSALVARLSKSGADIETAYDQLCSANAAVKKARVDVAEISQVVQLMAQATHAATSLLQLAAIV
jgi:hypothetical protein